MNNCGNEYYIKKSSISYLFISIGVVITALSYKSNAESFFPTALLNLTDGSVVDLSLFSTSGSQYPGVYPVTVNLNGEDLYKKDIQFVAIKDLNPYPLSVKDDTGLMACLTRDDLAGFNLNMKAFPVLELQSDNSCIDPGAIIPGASMSFDFQKLILNVSIPQIALNHHARGYIPPDRWDPGINAGLLNYNFSGAEGRSRYGKTSSNYLNLDSGFNLELWRLRDKRNWSTYRNQPSRWQHGSTTLSRAIIPWRSELTLGDGVSNGNIFDSFGFRGLQLASDDTMLPDSLRGYAPIIRGTAISNAQVSVTQNGYKVYQTTVAPGEFAINDLYPMYSSGDLVITVTEADGSIRTWSVPYSSLPVLVREGSLKYDLTLGALRTANDSYNNPSFMQGSITYGLPWGVTLYGGMQIADNYRAGSVGGGINLGTFGAISADVTQADSTLTNGEHSSGQSLRFLFARSLNTLGTTFQLMGYRYSTQGFHTFNETALKRMSGYTIVDEDGTVHQQDYYNLYDNKRHRLQATVSQRLGNIGSLYMTGTRQTYWNREGYSQSINTGFSSSMGPVTYSLTANLNKTAGFAQRDKNVALSLSVPLGKLLPNNNSQVYASFNTSRDNQGGIRHQAGLSGTLLEQRNLDWSISQSYARQSDVSSNARINYRGGFGESSLGYSYSDSYRQLSYGVSGGAILHAGGLTLGQYLGETNVLVSTPDASGIHVNNGIGIKTDSRGYAIYPWASSYRENRIVLDSASFDDATETEHTVTKVVPTRGALVRADFKTRRGNRVMMTLTHDGKPLPFGTSVSSGENSGIVGEEGVVYLSGLGDQGLLKAKWGTEPHQQCTVSYELNPDDASNAVLQKIEQCV